MANDGNYRELRYFTSWPVDKNILEEYTLPPVLERITGQKRVPFGVGTPLLLTHPSLFRENDRIVNSHGYLVIGKFALGSEKER